MGKDYADRNSFRCTRTSEDVWKTITPPDEALALLVVEPLHMSFYSFGHRLTPPIESCRNRPNTNENPPHNEYEPSRT